MQFQRPKFGTLAVATVLLILGGRLAWHAGQTEVGWELIRNEWTTTLGTCVGLERPSLADQAPEKQARFWLREVGRLGRAKQAPKVAAGAAWMLDTPQAGFFQRHFRANRATQGIPGLPLGALLELDREAVDREVDKFEDLCRDQCRRLIEDAPQLDPQNVQIWRARALLLFQHELMSFRMKPRREDWQSVLDECAKHDPENALYDYLGALYEWINSSNYRWEQAGYALDLRDAEGFERGNRRFAMGLTKPGLMFGTTGDSDTMVFLEHSTLSRMDRVTAAESRGIEARAANLILSLMRWQGLQESVQRQKGQLAAAVATLRAASHVARQISTTENSADIMPSHLIMRRWSLANLVTLAKESPGIIDAQEAKTLNAELRDVRLELAIVSQVGERRKTQDRTRQHRPETIAVSLAVIAQPLAEILLLLGICFAIFARLCARGQPAESARMGVMAHLAAWTVGFGLSYVVFGMCPAGLIPGSIQTWAVRGLFYVSFLIPFAGIVYILKRAFHVSYGQLIALLLSAALPCAVVMYWDLVCELLMAIVGRSHPLATLLLLVVGTYTGWLVVKTDVAFLRRSDLAGHRKGWLALLVMILSGLTTYPGLWIAEYVEANLESGVSVPPRVWSEAQPLGLLADDLRGGMHMEQYPWAWSLLQWHSYSGFYIGLALTLVILTAWFSRRLVRATPGGFREILRHGKLAYAGLIGIIAARSLVTAGIGALLLYLAATPSAIDEREAWYQRHYTRLVDADATRRELDAEIAAIRNDVALMAKLRQAADK